MKNAQTARTRSPKMCDIHFSESSLYSQLQVPPFIVCMTVSVQSLHYYASLVIRVMHEPPSCLWRKSPIISCPIHYDDLNVTESECVNT